MRLSDSHTQFSIAAHKMPLSLITDSSETASVTLRPTGLSFCIFSSGSREGQGQQNHQNNTGQGLYQSQPSPGFLPSYSRHGRQHCTDTVGLHRPDFITVTSLPSTAQSQDAGGTGHKATGSEKIELP